MKANFIRKQTDEKLADRNTFAQHLTTESPWKKVCLPGQAIRIKRISSNQLDLNNSLKEMKDSLVKHGCRPSLINEHFLKKDLFVKQNWTCYGKRHSTKIRQIRIRLVFTYNQFIPNITKTNENNWNILKINKNFK